MKGGLKGCGGASPSYETAPPHEGEGMKEATSTHRKREEQVYEYISGQGEFIFALLCYLGKCFVDNDKI